MSPNQRFLALYAVLLVVTCGIARGECVSGESVRCSDGQTYPVSAEWAAMQTKLMACGNAFDECARTTGDLRTCSNIENDCLDQAGVPRSN